MATQRKIPRSHAAALENPERRKPKAYVLGGVARYCSPGCGHDCTREEHELAKTRGAALARTLGPGWKVRVWENLGWHFEAHKGVAMMIGHHPTVGKPYYNLFINSVFQLVVRDGNDPVKLLKKGMTQASKMVATMQSDLDRIAEVAS